jgi:lysophospholipase L1-like esterase
MTRRLRLVWQVPVYLLVLLLSLELLLQLGAWVAKEQSRLVPAQWLTGHTRILALGDSNTYGLYLKEQEAWPAQLEHQWNVAHPDSKIEVLNLGYPATNSFRVRNNLPGLLDKLSPDVVLIMVGFNDFWTPQEATDVGQQSGPVAWLKKNSRLYRLYTIAERSGVSQKDMVFGYPRGGWVDTGNASQKLVRIGDASFNMVAPLGEPARHRDGMPDNLKAMIRMVRDRDARVYLLTYPSSGGFYPGANRWLRTVAQEQGTPLIDITPLFVERCPDGAASCPDLLFHDGHATAQGNTLVADIINKELQAALQR